MGNAGGVRMGLDFARGCLFLGSESAADARLMPRRKIVVGTQSAEEVTDVRVVSRIFDQHRVVDVPGLLVPRIEDNLLPGVVRVERRRPPVAPDRKTGLDLPRPARRIRSDGSQ